MRHRSPILLFVAVTGMLVIPGGGWAQEPPKSKDELDLIAVESLIDAQTAEEPDDTAPSSGEEDAQNREKVIRPNRRVIDEIIVTAQKKEESIRDVPMSVMALSEEFITEKGISDMNALAAYTPNVKIDVTPTVGFVSMRGLGSGTNKGVEQSVGLMIDGVFYSRLDYISNGLMDLSRIEVLRGPQGTLFGKNTVAGAFNITTGAPTPDYQGYAYAATGTDNLRRIQLMGSGPVIEGWVNARFAFASDTFDGYIKNNAVLIDPDTPEYDRNVFNPFQNLKNKDNSSARLKLDFPDLMEGLKLGVSYTLAKASQNSFGAEIFVASETTRREYAKFDPNFEAAFNDVTAVGDREFNERTSHTYTLQADYDYSDFIFSAVGGYSRFNSSFLQDADYGALRIANQFTDDSYSQQSLELRVASPPGAFEYVSGLYYLGSRISGVSQILINGPRALALFAESRTNPSAGRAVSELRAAIDLLQDTTGVRVFGDENNNRLFDQTTDSKAVFGQLTWNVNPSLALIVGGRFSVEDKVLDLALTHSQPFGAALFRVGLGEDTNVFVNDRKKGEKNFSPKLSTIYRLNEDVNSYATYAQAFKSGGFNEQAANAMPASLDYDAEQAITYEAGSKMVLDGGAATLNVGLFNTEFKNLQVSIFDGTRFTVGNAAEAVTRGVEVEFNWLPTEWLTLGAAGAVLDARYKSYPAAQCPATSSQDTCDITGQRLVRAPKTNGVLSSQIQLPIPWINNAGVQLGWDYTFSDDVFLTTDNDPLAEQKAYSSQNFRLSLGDRDSRWSINYFLNNAFDDRYIIAANDIPLQPGTQAGVRNLGRKQQVEVRFKF